MTLPTTMGSPNSMWQSKAAILRPSSTSSISIRANKTIIATMRAPFFKAVALGNIQTFNLHCGLWIRYYEYGRPVGDSH